MSFGLSNGALRAISAGQQVDSPVCQVYFLKSINLLFS